jgi:topoisomerase-4 subunit B
VRNKTKTIYCYSEREKASALEEITSPEVTRFKGLGEISPKEFGQFIDKNIRLLEVNVRSIQNVPGTLEFYMGKNTPDRRDFIMENLI